jgi:hypothetical protein
MGVQAPVKTWGAGALEPSDGRTGPREDRLKKIGGSHGKQTAIEIQVQQSLCLRKVPFETHRLETQRRHIPNGSPDVNSGWENRRLSRE